MRRYSAIAIAREALRHHAGCGGTGGFKAIPGSGWATAEMLARGAPGDLAGPFGLERFREGRMIDESVATTVAH